MSTHERLFLALTAVKLRCRGGSDPDLPADITRICDDALQGLNVDHAPEEDARRSTAYYDRVRVDGVSGFEAEVRRVDPDPSPDPKDV